MASQGGAERFDKGTIARAFGSQGEAWERYYATGRARTVSDQNFLTRLDLVLEALGPANGRVLDVGCAAGAVSEILHDRGWTVTGMDIAPELIERARERVTSKGLNGIDFQVADVENLPYPDGSFDGAIAMGVTEYLSTDERALDELVRVVRPGGRLVVTVPNLLSPFRRLDGTLAAVERPLIPLLRVLRYGKGGARERGTRDRARLAHREYTLGRMERSLSQRGILVDHKSGHTWGSYRLDPIFPVGAALTRMTRSASKLPAVRSLGMSLVIAGVRVDAAPEGG